MDMVDCVSTNYISTGNSGWHIMKNTMGEFNSVLVNFMHTHYRAMGQLSLA